MRTGPPSRSGNTQGAARSPSASIPPGAFAVPRHRKATGRCAAGFVSSSVQQGWVFLLSQAECVELTGSWPRSSGPPNVAPIVHLVSFRWKVLKRRVHGNDLGARHSRIVWLPQLSIRALTFGEREACLQHRKGQSDPRRFRQGNARRRDGVHPCRHVGLRPQ